MDKISDPRNVTDRESFQAFVAALVADRRASIAESGSRGGPAYLDSGDWANDTIESFLEAALAWAKSTEMGVSQGLPAEPSWQGFAAFLYCGKLYE